MPKKNRKAEIQSLQCQRRKTFRLQRARSGHSLCGSPYGTAEQKKCNCERRKKATLLTNVFHRTHFFIG